MTDNQNDMEGEGPAVSRRSVLAAGLVGVGAVAGCSSDGETTTAEPPVSPTDPPNTPTPPGKSPIGTTETGDDSFLTPTEQPTRQPGQTDTPTPEPELAPGDVPQAPPRGAHHPGPPRFTSVGAEPVGELLHGDRVEVELSGVDGDLAPFNPVAEESYAWSIADAPADSEATLSEEPVVHFEPDVPGTYTLELIAPETTHELTVRAFPEESEDDPQPRVTLHGEREGEEYVLTADAEPSPESDRDPEALDVEFYVDDRDKGSFEDSLSVDGHTATLPADAVSDTLRVHAVAAGDRHSVADFVRIESDGTVAHPNDPPEWIRDATMYEIFVRGFGRDVTFEYLRQNLQYIDELGVDVVWLTPVLEAHSHANPSVPGGPHGYDITNYFETADALGSREAYEAFVEACHERDIKVIFDLVVNHTAREHRYFQAAENGRGVTSEDQEFFYDLYEWRSPYSALAYFGWSGIPVVDYDSLALRAWITSIVDEWQAVVDGFRCDVAWGVPRSFWKAVRHRVKDRDPEFLLLDETVPWDSEYAEDQFDVHFDYGLFETLREVAGGTAPATDLQGVLDDRAAKGYPDHTGFVNYVENHDEDRFLGLTDEQTQMAAGAATFTVPGTPMVYYGQETGLTNARQTMNWGSIDEELHTHYQRLIELRDSEPALASGAAMHAVELRDRPDGVVAYARASEDSQVLVVLNFGEETATVALPEGVETTDLIGEADVSAGEGAVAVESAVVLRADDASLA